MTDKNIKQDLVSDKQLKERIFLETALNSKNVPTNHKINNLGLYIKTGSLAHILFMNEAYNLIKNIPGIIMEFGVWYGANLILFENLRAIHEPFNKLRKIVGFDTFNGYPAKSRSSEDLSAEKAGYLDKDIYALDKDYTNFLKDTIEFHENNNVLNHIKKNEIVKGNVEDTLPIYLKDNPSTVIAFVYLDLALFKSTKFVIENILPYLIKGSVIMFDEFNHPSIHGDTLSFRECILKRGLDYKIKISKYMNSKTFLIIQ